ncbi:hypothetical protein B7494_g5879 [Chlorociboria aeruginascens]|nr:hypothetical protein B7494_g5879 [Chlorociboria aeruginascens]
MRARALPQLSLLSPHKPPSSRHLSTTAPKPSTTPSPPPPAPNPRWLSTTKSRLGHCLSFGLNPAQTHTAGRVARNTRHLMARPDRGRRGVSRGQEERGAAAAPGGLGGDGQHGACEQRDVHAPITYPNHISVFHKLAALPAPDADSFTLDVLMLSELEQRVAARCVEDIVVYDYRAGQKVRMRGWMREAFERTWEEQERAQVMNGETRAWIEEVVRGLEKGSWNRVGASEDLGSAGG